jgi:hypothetical protein
MVCLQPRRVKFRLTWAGQRRQPLSRFCNFANGNHTSSIWMGHGAAVALSEARLLQPDHASFPGAPSPGTRAWDSTIPPGHAFVIGGRTHGHESSVWLSTSQWIAYVVRYIANQNSQQKEQSCFSGERGKPQFYEC